MTAGGLSPTAISNSWGSSEFSGEHTLDGDFTFAGVMVTVSTGDNGYGATWPASAPNVTAVGGTVLTADSSARGWSETVWSGAASGCSSQEAKPAWQSDSGCANRTIADVSALAGTPGESIYDTYGGDTGWEDFGGTSLSSPIIASVYALGYPDSPMSSTYANPSSLFDVTSGSNGSCSGSYLCTGSPGYDGPTGLGTPCGTTDFGTGPFMTPACVTLAPTPSAQPALVEVGAHADVGVHAGVQQALGGLRQLRRRPDHQGLSGRLHEARRPLTNTDTDGVFRSRSPASAARSGPMPLAVGHAGVTIGTWTRTRRGSWRGVGRSSRDAPRALVPTRSSRRRPVRGVRGLPRRPVRGLL